MASYSHKKRRLLKRSSQSKEKEEGAPPVNGITGVCVYFFMKKAKRFFSFAFAMAMLFACLFGLSATASAASSLSKVKGVSYELDVVKSDVKIGIWTVYQKKATVTWSAVSGADGYEVEYNYNNQYTKTVSTTSRTWSCGYNTHGPFAGANIYPLYTVRVRAYEIVNGRKVYGPWSSRKTLWM